MNRCRLQRIPGQALERFYAELGQYSLADLHVGSRKLQALFELHPATKPA